MNREETNKYFVPPTLEEVTEYCDEIGRTVDPNKFHAFYSANGWKVGRNGMKDWRAAIRYWESNAHANNGKKSSQQEILERELRIAKTYRA